MDLFRPGRMLGRNQPAAWIGGPVNTPMERQESQPPAGGRRVMSTGVGIALIAVGAILRFALAPGSPHGLNLHVVGVVLILVGILGLLLSLLFAGWPRQRRLIRWSRPGDAYDRPAGRSRLARRRRAAEDDVAAIREDDRFYAPDATGRQDSGL